MANLLCVCDKEISSLHYVHSINRLVKSEMLSKRFAPLILSSAPCGSGVAHSFALYHSGLAPALGSVPQMVVTVVFPPSCNPVLFHM